MKKIISGQECHNDSIPRLELSSAVVAATWRDYLVRNAGEDFDEIILMTDATATKYRIGDWEGKYKTYENFRLRRIRSLSAVSEWHYCPTDQNPADYTSKGLQADDKKWAMFHSGPPFLFLLKGFQVGDSGFNDLHSSTEALNGQVKFICKRVGYSKLVVGLCNASIIGLQDFFL